MGKSGGATASRDSRRTAILPKPPTLSKNGKRVGRPPTSASGSAPTHIRPQDVAAFARGNHPDVPAVGYHYGSAAHVSRLMREGVDVSRNFQGVYGHGFYVYPHAVKGNPYGTRSVKVALHIERPYIFKSAYAYGKIAAHYANRYGEAEWGKRFTADLLRKGYDGIIAKGSVFRFGKEVSPDHIAAIKPGTVRVISPSS